VPTLTVRSLDDDVYHELAQARQILSDAVRRRSRWAGAKLGGPRLYTRITVSPIANRM